MAITLEISDGCMRSAGVFDYKYKSLSFFFFPLMFRAITSSIQPSGASTFPDGGDSYGRTIGCMSLQSDRQGMDVCTLHIPVIHIGHRCECLECPALPAL